MRTATIENAKRTEFVKHLVAVCKTFEKNLVFQTTSLGNRLTVDTTTFQPTLHFICKICPIKPVQTRGFVKQFRSALSSCLSVQVGL